MASVILGVLAVICALTITEAKLLQYFPHADSANVEVMDQSVRVVSDSKPKFSNDLDCPPFTITTKTKEYEERNYGESRWVTTEAAGIDYDAASYKMFMKLFQYIQGNNDRGLKIDMTCPVLVRIIPGQGPACESNFTMSFYLAPSLTDPPTPKDSTVYLSSLPQQSVYVRSFGGFASLSKWLSEAKELSEALPDTAHYVQDYYYTAGYDAPFKFLNRHNEIWFLSTN